MQQKFFIATLFSIITILNWIIYPAQLFYQLVAMILYLITLYRQKTILVSFVLTIILSLFQNNVAYILSFYFMHYSLIPFIGIIFSFNQSNIFSYILIYCLMFTLFFIERSFVKKQTTLLHHRDILRKENLILLDMQKNLLSQQQNYLNESLLNERNRISCEIHDQSGHMIASTIMQIAALKMSENDKNKIETLNMIQKNLQHSMTQIRNILHNEVILDELKSEIQKIASLYPQLQTTMHCDYLSQLALNTIVHLSAITKEAFTNVIKHTNATTVLIDIYENDQFLVYRFEDNGTNKPIPKHGIGLYSMKLRAQSLDGLLTISKDYKIHLRIKRENL